MTRFDQRVLDALRTRTATTTGGITQVLGCTPNRVAKALQRLRKGSHVVRDPDAGLTSWKVSETK